MGDVHCSTCEEPWDAYGLQHEIIYETDLSHEEAKAWEALPFREKLSEKYREKFKALKWEFGRSVLNVRHCPACPEGAEIDEESALIKAAIEDVLGDDEDGLAVEYEDLGL